MKRKKTIVLMSCAFANAFLIGFAAGKWSQRSNKTGSVIKSAESNSIEDHQSEQSENAEQSENVVAAAGQAPLQRQTSEKYVESQTSSVDQGSGYSYYIVKPSSEYDDNQQVGSTDEDFNGQLPYDSPDSDNQGNASDYDSKEPVTISDSSTDIEKDKIETLYNRSKTMEGQLNDLYSGLYMLKIGMHSLAGSSDRLLQGIESDGTINGETDIANNGNDLSHITATIQQISQSLKTMSDEKGLESLQRLNMKIQDENDKNIKDLEEMLKETEYN